MVGAVPVWRAFLMVGATVERPRLLPQRRPLPDPCREIGEGNLPLSSVIGQEDGYGSVLDPIQDPEGGGHWPGVKVRESRPVRPLVPR